MEVPSPVPPSVPDELTVFVNGKRVHMTVAGRGHGVVLLHSLLADHTSFDRVFEPLSRTHKVTLVSLPGFGTSEVVRGGLDVVAEHLALALSECDLGSQPVFIGNGYGAFLAATLAVQHPHLAAKLVLVGCGAAFSGSGRKAFARMSLKVREQGLSGVVDIAMARLFPAKFRESHPEIMGQRQRCFLAMSPDTFDDACRTLATLDLKADLHKVRVPVMVIVGKCDEATPPDMARELVAMLPNARLCVLPDCAHVPQLQNPPSFLAAVREFVDA